MLSRLFAANVVTVVATEAMWSGRLHPDEEAFVARAVEKRRREFTAGRESARTALARFGIRDFALRAADDRTPIWPDGFVGSIAHTRGFCGVAVGRTEHWWSLGLDVESVAPLEPGLHARVCTREELDRAPSDAPIDFAKFVFSAKEATYKCYYPVARQALDFRDVSVSVDFASGRFVARLARATAASARGVREFHGRLEYDDRFVYTGVSLGVGGA